MDVDFVLLTEHHAFGEVVQLHCGDLGFRVDFGYFLPSDLLQELRKFDTILASRLG